MLGPTSLKESWPKRPKSLIVLSGIVRLGFTMVSLFLVCLPSFTLTSSASTGMGSTTFDSYASSFVTSMLIVSPKVLGYSITIVSRSRQHQSYLLRDRPSYGIIIVVSVVRSPLRSAL